MLNILISLFLIFYLVLAKIRLDWAVMLLIVALPSYLIRFSVFSIPFTLLEAMILISFAVWLLNNYKEIFQNLKFKIISKFKIQNSKFIRYPFDIEISLLLIISFIAVAVAGFSDSSLGIWKAYFFEPILVFILTLNVFKKELNSLSVKELSSFFAKILWPLAISAFVVSIFAIYQKFTGHFIFNELWAAEETRRVVSFFGYPNAVGLYLAPLVLIMIGWIINKIFNFQSFGSAQDKLSIFSEFSIFNFQFFKILFIGLTIVLSLLSIYFAKSEGALVGVLAGLAVFGVLAGRKIRLAVLLLVFIIGTGIMIYQPARDYAVEKITLSDLSGEIRKQQWKETWQMMTVSPTKFIFGAGLANYQNAIVPYHQEGIFFNKDNDPEFHRHVVWNEKYRVSHWQPVEIYMYPHNILLNFWTELGLAGVLLFIWIFIKFWAIGLKIIRNSNIANAEYLIIGLMCSMVAIIAHGFVDVPYFKNDLAIMFWILIAMMGFYNLEYKTNT